MIELADGAPWMAALKLLDLSGNADLFRAGLSGISPASSTRLWSRALLVLPAPEQFRCRVFMINTNRI